MMREMYVTLGNIYIFIYSEEQSSVIGSDCLYDDDDDGGLECRLMALLFNSG